MIEGFEKLPSMPPYPDSWKNADGSFYINDRGEGIYRLTWKFAKDKIVSFDGTLKEIKEKIKQL